MQKKKQQEGSTTLTTLRGEIPVPAGLDVMDVEKVTEWAWKTLPDELDYKRAFFIVSHILGSGFHTSREYQRIVSGLLACGLENEANAFARIVAANRTRWVQGFMG